LAQPLTNESLMARFSRSLRGLKQRNLYQQIIWARFWLPLTIIGVVLIHMRLIVPLGGPQYQFWSTLLFYSILGPSVTFITLSWIGQQVKRREEAQAELKMLYEELQESHALLGAIQAITEQFAAATDLESLLSAATQGISQITGARGVAIILDSDGVGLSESYGLSSDLIHDALGRDRALRKRALATTVTVAGQHYWLLVEPLAPAGKLLGSVHAYYTEQPSGDQLESFRILAAQVAAAAEAAHSRTRDVLTLVEVDRSIRAEGNLERLLLKLLSQMMHRADATAGGVYLADGESLLQLKVCKGISKPVGAVAVRLGDGLIGEVAAATVPRIVTELSLLDHADPLLRQGGSAVALPLLTEAELLGVVVLVHEAAQHFQEATLPFLSLVAGQVSLAVRNARAYLQSEELAIAEERARIAREIHDGVAQSLAFSALKLDLVTRLLESDRDKAELELSHIKTTLRELIKEVRRSIFALRPVDLERHGFIETLRRFCQDYSQQNGIAAEFHCEHLPQLTLKSEAVLFRIFQEAMHNVAKHAAATKVEVRLGLGPDGQTFITVSDNGKGFDESLVGDRVTSAGGLGLKQMRERIESRGGTFCVSTAPQTGTTVYASVYE
jgi:signal transduction histidine kinase